ncbi:gfo/Idh/MocA family oxidoreductase [bacterium]|nr:gfo/Idh/MocA family oxidoreductase [bacterium]
MIRIGIVGCGRILAAHLRGYRLLREAGIDDFRITALCARNIDDAAAYAKRGSGPAQREAVSSIAGDPLAVADEYVSDFQDDVDVELFDDWRQMIESGPIDSVNDYTLHGLHHQIALLSAEHGKHLLTQKPISVTVHGGEIMCEAFERADLTLGVFENWRYRPETIQLLTLLEAGHLGEPQLLLAGAIAAWWAPDQIVAQTPWRHRKEQAGGITLDMGVHQFDSVRAIGGEVRSIDGRALTIEPVRVTRGPNGHVIDEVDCDADDTYFATFETEHGAIGSLHASWAGHGGATISGPGPVVHTTKGRICGDRIELDGHAHATIQETYERLIGEDRRARDLPCGLDDSFALTQYDWLEAIRQKRQPVTDGREGLRDLACAWAVLESSQAGRRVMLDEILSGELCDAQREIAAHFGLPR